MKHITQELLPETDPKLARFSAGRIQTNNDVCRKSLPGGALGSEVKCQHIRWPISMQKQPVEPANQGLIAQNQHNLCLPDMQRHQGFFNECFQVG